MTNMNQDRFGFNEGWLQMRSTIKDDQHELTSYCNKDKLTYGKPNFKQMKVVVWYIIIN